MNHKKRTYPPMLLLFPLLFMVLIWSSTSSAATRVVESVDINSRVAGAGIVFHFNDPMQFKSYFRKNSGKLVQIELRTLDRIQDVYEFTRRYNLSWNTSATNLLSEITYEGIATGEIRLLLRFRQAVNFKLVGSPNPRNLKIEISQVDVVATDRVIISEKPSKIHPLDKKEEQLLDEAENAMIDNDFRRAVQIYTKLTQSADPGVRKQSQEFLGLARERNGQLAHSKAEYEKYLKLYPNGEGTERVKQRLAGLLSAYASPRKSLRKAKNTESGNQWRSGLYGSFSQFYDRDETYTQADEKILNRSALRSDIDINVRSGNDNFDINSTFIGGRENDFRDDGDDESRVSSLYLDLHARRFDLSTRIGRQSRSSGGVLGRFDGGMINWQASDFFAVNLVGGYPVASTTETEIDDTRPLYGISFDLGTFANKWDFNVYYITQEVDDIIDREAVGGEVRYFSGSSSFFSLVDYDITYDELNTALLTANYTLQSGTSFNFSFDYRNSPILTTSNALIGQTVTTIEQLLQTINEDEIRQLALDRTATTRSYILGVTQPINEKLQISSDLTISETSGTPASSGVLAQPGTGLDYFYSLQFVGSSLIKDGDIAIVGLRYADTDFSSTYSASINTRYPVTRGFRVNPRAVVDFRSNKEDDGKQWKFRPSLRLEYTWEKLYHLEVEGGGEWSSAKLAGQTDKTSGYFITVGYRINF